MPRFHCHDQKKRAAALALRFEALLACGAEREIIAILRDEARAHPGPPPGSQLLQDVFFIWIGCLPPAALAYIDVWKEALQGKGSVRIYYDSHFLLFNHYRRLFHALYPLRTDTPAAEWIQYQDHFKRLIDAGMMQGKTFDQALIGACAQLAPRESARLQADLLLSQQRLAALQCQYVLRDIRQERGLFFEPFFARIYHQELCLRANAAAAADILRLLLLYRHGGVYVDVDTLPSLDGVFGPLSDQANGNIQSIVRAELFLQRRQSLRPAGPAAPDADDCYRQALQAQAPHLLASLHHLAGRWDGTPLPAPRIHAREHLLAMAAMASCGQFNNNLLAALPGSRLVRILLREIKRRYRFLFRYRLEHGPQPDLPAHHYLARLRDYRYDALQEQDHVTLFLTGPVMMLEVLLGMAYSVLDLDQRVSPLALSYVLRLDSLGIACTEQTAYTPEHMRSSWM
ncbi:hypothetical protein THUN1379_25430 [Paludibacterium sp. THUN1379]|uniref:TcdA/TcdB catalytic glycosyltransferase domain-containing protein n=1 Tax=Paludibacterium sp. THUN1379 TaxID=3112107 RepID=UPI00308E1E9B|nr:hypothetical protein THUN1379_25430 [Paludibacterium sp. THUN1379]